MNKLIETFFKMLYLKINYVNLEKKAYKVFLQTRVEKNLWLIELN
jgi:hypothetical protein